MADRTCSVPECNSLAKRRGWCGKHYMRWYRTGTVATATVADRFFAKVEKQPGGCWAWTAYTDRDGYGRFYPSRLDSIKAHRWAYEHHIGPIPEGLEIDHLCRVRHCVNPQHLEAVTHAENMRRVCA